MRIEPDTPLPEVARAVCTALELANVTAVLTGGSAATYYAPDAYQSSDIDFVTVSFGADGNEVENQLTAIGFRQQRDHYRHPRSPYPIEFPPGPLAVGREIVTEWRTDRTVDGVLHVLTATDSCKDRLAAFLHWNDRAGLAQALAVARSVGEQIDFDSLAAWAESEGEGAKYREFTERLGEGDLESPSARERRKRPN